MNRTCKACEKKMTDAEYIKYLEKEILRLEMELVQSKAICIPSVFSSPPIVWGNTSNCEIRGEQ